MKFKVDENLPAKVRDQLRNAGHEAATVLDEGLGGRPDSDIAEVCRSEARVLITLDTALAHRRRQQRKPVTVTLSRQDTGGEQVCHRKSGN